MLGENEKKAQICVGILTLPLHNNYGGNLQAYALMAFLKRLGILPTLFRLTPLPEKISKKIAVITKQIIKKYLLGYKDVGNPLTVGIPEKERQLIKKNSTYFIQNYLQPQTSNIQGIKEVNKLAKNEFGAFIAGSDQIWRKRYVGEYIDAFFLNFPVKPGVKKIIYAASFGVEEWQYSKRETQKLRRLIQQMDAVSVRENSGVKLCKDELSVDVEQVLDPTLLLEKKDYLALIEREAPTISKGDLLLYILNEKSEKKQIINKIETIVKLKPFTVSAKSHDKHEDIEQRIYPSVFQWLKGFDDAKYIITDSFHGCVFAIIFNKPFIAIGNKQRGMTRFTSLLEKFGLKDRLVNSLSDCSDERVLDPIDWEKVGKILCRERRHSINFICQSLGIVSPDGDLK